METNIEKNEIIQLEEEFSTLKNKYVSACHNVWTMEEERESLVRQMRENLRQRIADENQNSIVGLDGNTYSLDSTNPSDLFAIDGALVYKRKQGQSEKADNAIRENMTKNNHYSKDNPYYEK